MEQLLLRPPEAVDSLGLNRSKVHVLVMVQTIQSIPRGSQGPVPAGAVRSWSPAGGKEDSQSAMELPGER